MYTIALTHQVSDLVILSLLNITSKYFKKVSTYCVMIGISLDIYVPFEITGHKLINAKYINY